MEQKVNHGYVITDTIRIAGNSYVLGCHPTAPASFVTWAADATGGYTYGHYFTTEDAARLDLFKRALDAMPEALSREVILSNLSEEDRAAIKEEGRRENYVADIESCLFDALNHLGFDCDKLSMLMASEEFMAHAFRVYHNQDHSYENEALTESLESLVEDRYANLLLK